MKYLKSFQQTFYKIFCSLALIFFISLTCQGQIKSISGKWKLDIIRDKDSTAVDVTKDSWEHQEIFAYLSFINRNCTVSDGILKNTGSWLISKGYLIIKLKKRKLSYKIHSLNQKELVIGWPSGSGYSLKLFYKKQISK